MRTALLVVTLALIASACASAAVPDLAAESTLTTPPDPPPTTTAPTAATDSSSASTATVEPATTSTTEFIPGDCVVISDFSADEDHSAWQIVNDDVMGGRSLGDRRFTDDRMIFEGSINTDGGGFSSLRRPLPPGTLEGMSTIRMRADGDTRTYMLTIEDALEGRNPRVNHRAVLEFGDDGRAEVEFGDLLPAIFGQLVEDQPIVPALVDEIGLMVSDGIDGAFSISVHWVAGCP